MCNLNAQGVEAMIKLCSIFCVAAPSLPKQNINMEKHDTVSVGRVVNWNNRISCGDKWYEHVPENVAKNEGVKPLWDFTIQTDSEVHTKRRRGRRLLWTLQFQKWVR